MRWKVRTIWGGDSQSAGLQKRNNNTPNRHFGSPIKTVIEQLGSCISSKCWNKSLQLPSCSITVFIKERKVPSWKGRTGASLHSWTRCTMTSEWNRDIKHLSWGWGIYLTRGLLVYAFSFIYVANRGEGGSGRWRQFLPQGRLRGKCIKYDQKYLFIFMT